jgi:hypothetical protein
MEEFAMEHRRGSDLDAILGNRPKAPVLPKPRGKTLRVATTEELKHALRTADSGSTILLADGIYRTESLLLQDREQITIRSESGDRGKVILDGEETAVPGQRHWALALHGTPDFTISDITMRNFGYGVYIFGDGNVERPLIHNMKFENIWVRGVKGTLARWVWDHWDEAHRLSAEQMEMVLPHDGRIQHCLFVNDRPKEDMGDGANGDYISGIDMACIAGWMISDNTFVDIRGRNGGGRGAIFVWMDSRGVIAERNVIVNCDRGICFGNPSGDFPHMTRGIARNNFIVAGTRQGIEFHQTVDCIACHNTIYAQDPTYERTVEFQNGNRGPRFINNLVHGRMHMQNDVQQQCNIVGDLGNWFIDPAIGDLHLDDKAGDAIGKAIPLREVQEDIDRRPRSPRPTAGAAEKQI